MAFSQQELVADAYVNKNMESSTIIALCSTFTGDKLRNDADAKLCLVSILPGDY